MTPNRPNALVIAADSARARLFLTDGTLHSELREIASLENADARLHERDLVAAPVGRRGGEATQSGHSAYGGGSMKAHRKEDFAADVSSQLVRCLRETQATRVYVLADPEFLGLLRQRMDARTRGCVVGEIDKSVARHSPAQIRTSLPSLL